MADERMVRVAEIEVDPAQLDAYLAFLTEEIAASVEREPGVLMLHAVADKTAPHSIRILEVYASRAAYEAHIETPHFRKYKEGTADMVTALRLVDMDPIILAAR
ncbi:antibiotic biosynthesis monooxygenase [Devosia sp. BK]|uniref:putative quinol monooxygenase n=1 Tax=unclassified Devosia TaxID=196773 RepID=UPI0007129093|nr:MULTISPECIES: putative quinol monooxygenase [unclassified Devosia]KQT46898.1 antibiotic biosynthesis monooxygenase [Devosia sp. Leaf420]MDV3253186.1 antibiotic biosynthesis monooxygenase [Devosia sp. BK]